MMTGLDQRRVDLVLQYVLVRAAQEDDWRDRELGPIHLLKYVYLADCAYAERHEGQTFTGATWQFYHFGPWQPAIHDRIEPALAAICADKKTIRSGRDDDFIRFSVSHDADHLRDDLENQLPSGIAHTIADAVRQFGANTAALLRHVYLTPPMVQSAPGETLIFAPLEQPHAVATAEDATATLTVKQKRQKKEVLATLKETVRARLAERIAAQQHRVMPEPRYDGVFAAGTEWLDVLAGEPVEPLTGELTVAPGVWKSPTRTDPDVP
jgi:hypothetical protein